MRKLHTHAIMPTKQNCRYCDTSHTPKWWPAYEKKCAKCSKVKYFGEVYRSAENVALYNVGQESDQNQEEEDQIDRVSINSINVSNNCSV